MRVLIVDDQPLAQRALANILSARSDVEHFAAASDAIEALEKLATDSYDVLLLDIDLDLSGSQLVAQLGERELPLPSIVFATAHVEKRGRSLREAHRRLRAKTFLERKHQRSLGSSRSESKGGASRKIDRSFAAVAEAVFSASPDDRNQG